MAPNTENVENPFGLKALWEQGGVVAHGTLIIMVILVIGYFVLVVRLSDKEYRDVIAERFGEGR